MARISAPNSAYNGTIGDVHFKNGQAETDNLAVITYCRGAGYAIDGVTVEREPEPQPVDSRDVETVHLGSRLRDAAVDPRPGDAGIPSNAGKADPHSPAVVAGTRLRLPALPSRRPR